MSAAVFQVLFFFIHSTVSTVGRNANVAACAGRVNSQSTAMKRVVFTGLVAVFLVSCTAASGVPQSTESAVTGPGVISTVKSAPKEALPGTGGTVLAEKSQRLVIVGDVSCPVAERPCADESVRDVVVGLAPDQVVFAGDVQYQSHSYEEYVKSFLPVWGSLRGVSLAVPGNHEYGEYRAEGFFKSWTESPTGWWEKKLGEWLVVGINTNDDCRVVSCDAGSAQYAWLEGVLSRSGLCTLVVGHHPRWSSGVHGNTAELSDIWGLLERQRVEAYVSGHDHHYERVPGAVTQYVVGTGGAELRQFSATNHPSVLEHGVLVLDLRDGWADVWFQGPKGVSDRHEVVCR